ncbi:hypothetical protein EDB47_13351, partial [Vibrio crassostreae]
MEQTNEVLLEESAAVDDWGDFGAVIDQLEQQEQGETDSVNLTDSTETVTEDKTEAMAG